MVTRILDATRQHVPGFYTSAATVSLELPAGDSAPVRRVPFVAGTEGDALRGRNVRA